jgi:hypothetical protein
MPQNLRLKPAYYMTLIITPLILIMHRAVDCHKKVIVRIVTFVTLKDRLSGSPE